jgi:hypothetical protein
MIRLLMVLTVGVALAYGAGPALAQPAPVVPQTGIERSIHWAMKSTRPFRTPQPRRRAWPTRSFPARVMQPRLWSTSPPRPIRSARWSGAVLGGLESKLLEVVLEHGKLKERVTTLEADNTKRAIDLQHARALVDQQATQIATLTQQVQSMQSEMAAALGAMEQQAGSLQARIAELERTKGTITAPFKVLDSSGFPMVLIDENGATFSIVGGGSTNIALKQGSHPQIYLGDQASGVSIEAGETNRISIVSGDSAVFELKQDAGQGVMMTATTTEGSVELGSGPGLVGIMVKKGDQPAAGLGTFDGRGIALRVFAASGMVVGAMGENPGAPGTGIAYVGNGTQNAAALAVAQDGSGIVHAFATDGTVGSGLIGGDRMVAAYNAAGNAVVTIGKSENSEGGNVTARDPAGDGIFRAGYNSAVTGGDACVYRAKRQNVFCLGIGAPGMGIGTF